MKTQTPDAFTDLSRKIEVIIADLKIAQQDLSEIRAKLSRDTTEGRVLGYAMARPDC